MLILNPDRKFMESHKILCNTAKTLKTNASYVVCVITTSQSLYDVTAMYPDLFFVRMCTMCSTMAKRLAYTCV